MVWNRTVNNKGVWETMSLWILIWNTIKGLKIKGSLEQTFLKPVLREIAEMKTLAKTFDLEIGVK